MNASSDRLFGIVWGVLFFAPIVGVLSYFLLRRAGRRWWRPFCLTSAMVFIVVALSWVAGLSTTSKAVNLSLLLAAFSAYCILVNGLWRFDLEPSVRFAHVLLYTPLIFTYVLSTVGLLVIVLSLDDYFQPPSEALQAKSGLLCEVSDEGGFGTAWISFRYYRSWSFLPLLRREVGSWTLNLEDTQATETYSCETVAQKIGLRWP